MAFAVFLASAVAMLRRLGPWIAIAGVLLIASTGAVDAAVNGRPYAIVSAAFGWSVFVWLNNGARYTPARCIALWALLSTAVAMHFYGVLMVAALAIMEAAWAVRYGALRRGHWVAIGAATVVLLPQLWIIRSIMQWTHANRVAPAYFAPPVLPSLLFETFWLLCTAKVAIAIGIALIAVALARPAGARAVRHETFPPDLDLAAAGALALPVLAFVFAWSVTGAFHVRYYYAAALGVGILAALWLSTQSRAAAVAVVLSLTLIALRGSGRPTAADPRVELLRSAPVSGPIVLPLAADFFELSEAAPEPLRSRLVYVGMPRGVAAPDPEPEIMAYAWKRRRPDLHIYTADEWLAQTSTFLLLSSGSSREGLTDWLVARSRADVIGHSGAIWLLEFRAFSTSNHVQ